MLLCLDSVDSAVAFSQVQLPSGDISFFKAFVSAMENPGHFWVQPITSDSSALEKLTTDLNHLYGSSAGHAVLNSYSVGDLCCAPFQFDNHWYRAEVLEIFQDGMVDLYYVDYGDTGKVAKENLRELRYSLEFLEQSSYQFCSYHFITS